MLATKYNCCIILYGFFSFGSRFSCPLFILRAPDAAISIQGSGRKPFCLKKNMFSSMNTNPKPFVSLSVALFWLDGHVANRPISWSREAPSTRLPVIKEHGTSIRGIRYTIYISYSYTSFWYVICLFWGLPRFHDQTQPSADRRAAKRATKGPHLPSRRELGGDSLPSNLGSPIPT